MPREKFDNRSGISLRPSKRRSANASHNFRSRNSFSFDGFSRSPVRALFLSFVVFLLDLPSGSAVPTCPMTLPKTKTPVHLREQLSRLNGFSRFWKPNSVSLSQISFDLWSRDVRFADLPFRSKEHQAECQRPTVFPVENRWRV